MSDHLQMSGQSSLDKNFQIRTNNQGDNQLYIPCWEEEASSSTQYHHLIEETKFFKNKCRHLQNHLEENHREFSSLNQLYMIAQANQRRLLKENQDLRKNNREIINQLTQSKIVVDNTNNQMHAVSRREVQAREKFVKIKERERELLGQIQDLRSQCEQLRKKNPQGGIRSNQGDEQKWKRYYNEEIAKIQQQWKAAYEEIQSQFDRKSKEVRQKMQEIKTINKNCNAHKQDYQARIKGLQGQLQQAKRTLTKSKAQLSDYQRQIKDIKLVRDEVSLKNDEIQNENGRLKTKIKQESVRTNKIQLNFKELLTKHQQKQIENNRNIEQLNINKTTINELRNKILTLQNKIKEIQLERDRIQINKNYADNATVNLRQELTGLKSNKQAQIQSLRREYQVKIRENQGKLKDYQAKVRENQDRQRDYQNRLRQLKQQKLNEKSTLQSSISILRQQIEQLKRQKRDNSTSKNNQLQNQISILKQDIISWRSKYERLNTKYLQQKQQSSHETELVNLKQQIKKLGEQNRIKRQLIEDLALRDQQSKKQKKKLIQQKQNIKSRLSQQIESIEKQRDVLLIEKKQLLQKSKNKNELQLQNIERIKQLQSQLQQKQQQISKYKQKIKQDSKQTQKDKSKKYENKIKQKQKQIKQLQERIDQLQNQYQEQRSKNKNIQRDSRNQINKKQRKIKELENNIEQIKLEMANLQENGQSNIKEIQSLKKQNKQQQILNQKLKAQIAKDNEQKQNSISQQLNIILKQKEKQLGQLEEIHQKMKNQLKAKDQEVTLLRNKIDTLTLTIKPDTSANKTNGEMQQILKRRIRELQQQLKSKEELVKRYQNINKKDDEMAMGSLEQLQAQYSRELLALKRLIMYKGYKQDENKKIQQLKSEYQGKIQYILSDYKTMHQEMMLLKEKILNQRVTIVNQSIDIGAVEEIWSIKLEQISEERQVLIQKVAMWERKYEELRYLFQAKIQSKQQTINLLNLKLNNLQMSRPNCQYTCHHR